MRTFLIVLLSATLVFGLPFEESGGSNNISEDGWFVPQLDGSLKWMTKEEAAKAEQKLLLPRRKKELRVEFYLYTQDNPDVPQQIFIDNATSLSESNFNSNQKTRFIIHGWQDDYESDVNVEIRSAYLDEMGSYNVISVDWSQKSKKLNYMTSKSYVPKVGEKVAKMIDFLATEGNMPMENLKIIGHSLGAHVSGFAGKHVTAGQIQTIIGLDPAWPLFTFAGCSKRLCETDAIYVESIHTNGGLLGFLHPIGKAAFYPNGGKSQPGCGLDLAGSCSHFRSFFYYAESIRNDNFKSQQCSDWKYAVKKSCKPSDPEGVAKLGHHLNYKTVEGYFYTPVNKRTPFGTG